MGDGEPAVAADDDERVETDFVEHVDDAVGVIEDAFGRADRIDEGVSAVGGAENGAAEAKDTGDGARRQDAGTVRLDQPVEAVLESDDFDAAVTGAFHDGADNGVQSRRITAAREYAESLEHRHLHSSVAARIRGTICGSSFLRVGG